MSTPDTSPERVAPTSPPTLRRPAGMSLSTGLSILYGGENIRAAACGTPEEATPVIERLGCHEHFEPLVSWDALKLPHAEAIAYAQACIDAIRAQLVPRPEGEPAHSL